ncbi:MAG TPA: class I SAM-dependent methyltransferase [Longimicrobium sp.]|jgi:SAM-dependent methyltransferase|nr:class I SAM-dependent methyltransferase [Longimicrobium sp.]
MNCPACGSAALRTLLRLRVRLPTRTWRAPVQECAACTHRFLPTGDAEQREIEASYGSGYAGFRPDPVFEATIRREVRERLAPALPRDARVLDVGCGNGVFLSAITAEGYPARGVDVSEESARLCRERGLDARAGDFLTMPLDGPYDAVTFWDVMEHLREPAAFLERAREALAPGGALVLKIPGFERGVFYPIAAVPRLAGAMLGAPSHIQYFNRRSLEALLARTGFGAVEWFPSFAFRSPPRPRNPLRRAVVAAVRWMARVGGSGNLYLLARRPG